MQFPVKKKKNPINKGYLSELVSSYSLKFVLGGHRNNIYLKYMYTYGLLLYHELSATNMKLNIFCPCYRTNNPPWEDMMLEPSTSLLG